MASSTINFPVKYDETYFSKRFQPQHHYAAATLGCPMNTVIIDREVFRKNKAEKELVKAFKKDLGKSKHHKFESILKVTQ